MKTMPIYEYACKACGNEFEVQQSIKEEALTHCDRCGKEEAVRLISVSAFLLKGSVWAKDGYYSRVREEVKNLPREPESND